MSRYLVISILTDKDNVKSTSLSILNSAAQTLKFLHDNKSIAEMKAYRISTAISEKTLEAIAFTEKQIKGDTT